jgi:hypothetical protein
MTSFSAFSKDVFLGAVKQHSRILHRQQVSASGRELFWFERNL